MKRLWEIFDAIAAYHWRASDDAKRSGDDSAQGHHHLLAEAYVEAATVLKALVRDRTADPAIIDRAAKAGTYPSAVLTELGLPSHYSRISAIEGERA